MGSLLTLDTSVIFPTQSYLAGSKFAGILRLYREGKEGLLLPPVVRAAPNNRFGAIEGHHRLAVRDYLGVNGPVFLALSAQDFMPEHEWPSLSTKVASTNELIARRFEISYEPVYLHMNEEVCDSFTKLRAYAGVPTSAGPVHFPFTSSSL